LELQRLGSISALDLADKLKPFVGMVEQVHG
jgi:hypothetical protein